MLVFDMLSSPAAIDVESFSDLTHKEKLQSVA
jgi:hypothetical protein